MSWIVEVHARMNALRAEEYPAPPIPVASGEHVVGELPDHLRRLWVLRILAINTAELARRTFISRGSPGTDVAKVERIVREARLLDEMFWYSCNVEFPELFSKRSIGIRAGWLVVWSEVPAPQPMVPMGADGASPSVRTEHAFPVFVGGNALGVMAGGFRHGPRHPGGDRLPTVIGLPPGYDRSKK